MNKRSRWTVGKRIGAGFGLVLLVLAVVAGWSVLGFNGIVGNLADAVECNVIKGEIVQKQVDHFKWMDKVNAVFSDDKVTTVEVQTDPHKCAFGQWYYGEGRKHAQELIPETAKALAAIEDPHSRLHESVIELGAAYRQPHSGLSRTLAARLADHTAWVGKVSDALSREANLYAYQNRVQGVVEQATSILKACDEDDSLGDLQAKQARAIEIIKSMRYGPDGKDYLWINDSSPRMVMHPYKPELDGKDLSETADVNGKKLFVDMAQVCQADGAGYVVYYWAHPGTGEDTPKISYVSRYEPWDWIVGTGVFVSSDNKAFLGRLNDFAQGKPFELGVQADPTLCGFGKWLAQPDTAELCASFPELGQALNACRKPHEELHACAHKIEQLVTAGKMAEALRVYELQVGPALAQVEEHFTAGIDAEESLVAGANAAAQVLKGKTVPALVEVQGLLTQIGDAANEAATSRNDAIVTEARGTRLAVGVVSAIAIVVGIGMAFFIARSIIRVLTRVVRGLNEGAEQVKDAAAQVATASQSLAEGASEQASALEETSSALEEMAAMTRTNAENSKQANSLASQTRDAAKEGDQTMGKLNGAMNAINESSERISKIIKVIEEIAFQTNLLALNAAVEAARAGEHGKGFAVVADEVRNLAQRAAQAARETTGLIEDSVGRTREGTEVAAEVGSALSVIVENVSKVTELVNGISQASEEQAQGVDQVNTAVSQMDKVTQQNAAGAEESASASEELASQAEAVESMVGQLSALVGGAAGRGRTHAAPNPPVRHATASQPSCAGRPSSGQANTGSPEEFLSMDDRDLKDF